MARKVLLIAFLTFSFNAFSKTIKSDKSIIDIHVHIACIDRIKNGCFISPKMLENIRYRYYLKSLGIKKRDIKNGVADELIISNLVLLVQQSTRLKQVIVLAMDGVIDQNGELDNDKTEVYIPNRYVYEITKKNPELLFGASINPYRKDALKRLDDAYQKGARLIKWLPNIMHINPADKKLIPFYLRLKKYNLPLLTHTGFEHSFSRSDNTLGDPAFLELPLSIGVKVIAAHFGTGGSNEGESNFARILPLFEKYPNLYGDISGLSLPTKMGSIRKILEQENLQDRILYGSDYPLLSFPVLSPLYHVFSLSPKKIYQLFKIKNRFDRDIVLKEMLGVTKESMNRSAHFFK